MSAAETDYAQTMGMWKQLVDVRFRLLALVPTLTAVGVGLLGNVANIGSLRVTLVAVLGLVTVFAVRIYDLRNSELHDFAVHRLKTIEARDLKLRRSARRYAVPDKESRTKMAATAESSGVKLGREWPLVLEGADELGGVVSERPPSATRFLGIRVQHDYALGLVYTASIAAWAAIASYSALARLTDLSPRALAWTVTLIVAMTVLLVDCGVRAHGAGDRYMKHVLTSGKPNAKWDAWDGKKPRWRDRPGKLVAKADAAHMVLTGENNTPHS